jgi:antitoxin (DNA-binding transcriptional repressor) of toxin-antitoxin stability system
MEQQTPIIGMHEAKTTLSRLVRRAVAGETILIGPHGRAQVKLVAIEAPARPPRRLGGLKGRLEVPDDFDADLPQDLIAAFEAQE